MQHVSPPPAAGPAGVRWFRPPELATAEASERALVFWKVCWGVIGIWGGFLLLMVAIDPETRTFRLQSVVTVAGMAFPLLELNRRGKTRLASALLIAGLLLHGAVRAWNLGGIEAPIVPIYLVLVMMGGLLLGARGSLWTGIACAAAAGVLAAGTETGLIPPAQFTHTALAMLAFAVFPIGFTVLLYRVIFGSLGTALGRAEAELQERRRVQLRLDLALDAGKIAVSERDMETGEIIGDPGPLQERGVPMKGRVVDIDGWKERVPAEDQEVFFRELERVQRGEVDGYRSGYRILGIDGILRYVEIVTKLAPPVRGESRRLVGVSIDVTAHKTAELELRERVKELRLLHEVARLIQRANFPLAELPARIAPMLPSAWQYPEDCVARVRIGAVEAASEGWVQTPWMQSVQFDTEAGPGRIDVAYTRERLPAAEGPFLHEERELLASLAEMLATHINWRAYRESLETQVATRTEELLAARDAADAANRAKSAFLANMSHEIRTPLHAVLGYSQLLLMDRALGPDTRERIETIHRSGNHLLGLVNDVLDLSKIEAGHLALQPGTFSIQNALNDVATIFRQQLADRDISCWVELAPGLPPAVEADEGRVRQVLVNLIGNACKFTRRGRIDIQATATPLDGSQVLVRVLVRDTGCGIEPADLARVFEPFEQGAQGARIGGTGLGISISRRLARAMGGDLTVDTEPGTGSCFAFTFRAGVRGAAPSAAEERLPLRLAPAHSGKRVLIVDDEQTNSELLDEMLSPLGFDVRNAATGAEGLRMHDAWHPDLLLMDLRLPDFDGREAIRRLRASGARTPVIVVSASSTNEDRDAVFAAGAQDFLPKPFPAPLFYDKVKRLLGIEYEYAQAAAPVDVDAGPAVREVLSPALRREIAEATRSARVERLNALLERASEDAPVTARRLGALADSFQFEALLAAVEGDAHE